MATAQMGPPTDGSFCWQELPAEMLPGVEVFVARRVSERRALIGMAMLLPEIGWWDVDRNCPLPWQPQYWFPILPLPNMAPAAPTDAPAGE